MCRIKAPPAGDFDVDPTLSPILGKSLLSPDQPEAIALDLCKSVQKLHDLSTKDVSDKSIKTQSMTYNCKRLLSHWSTAGVH